jgi:hypothetical protein
MLGDEYVLRMSMRTIWSIVYEVDEVPWTLFDPSVTSILLLELLNLTLPRKVDPFLNASATVGEAAAECNLTYAEHCPLVAATRYSTALALVTSIPNDPWIAAAAE